MSDVLTGKELTEFKDGGADEQLVLTEEFTYEGEEITRTTEVAKLDKGGMCIHQKDQTVEMVYLSQGAMDAVLSYLQGETDTERGTERFEELTDEFMEKAEECREKAQNAESEELAASHYGWADALDYAWSRLAEVTNDGE